MQVSPISEYLHKYVDKVDENYKWTFDEALASKHTGLIFEAGDGWYAKTIKLKDSLRAELSCGVSRDEHLRIAKYFISDWGGVKTNKDLEIIIDRTRELVQEGRHAFEDVGLKGVSSWSKYLSLLCDWAPIYDSRVAFSINAINYMANNLDGFYPMPEGRSPRLSLIDLETLYVLPKLKEGLISEQDFAHPHFSSRVQKKFHIPARQAYGKYVLLLDDVARQLGLECGGRDVVEMLLFAMAPDRILADLIAYLGQSR